MELMTRVQILDEAVCVSLRGNGLRKAMKPFILTPATDKAYFIRQSVWEKENSDFKLALLNLKSDFVSLPVRDGDGGE